VVTIPAQARTLATVKPRATGGRVLPRCVLVLLALFIAPHAAVAAEKKPLLAVKVDGKDPDSFLASLKQFEDWFGQPVDGVLSYTSMASWKDLESTVARNTGFWAKADRSVLFSIPLIPARTEGKEKATLAAAGKGLYNEHYKTVAQMLAKFRPQDPVIYVRTGWEFNGGWFPWTVHGGRGDDFIAAFRQFVTTFRSVSPRFRFDWCPVWGDQVRGNNGKPANLADFYPGDEYVDVIGLDVYDETKYTKITNPWKRWDFYMRRGHGLAWHRSFAQKHGKPMSFPEWGVGGGGDDPYFMEQFHKWIQDNNVVYHTYWNSNASYKGKLSTDAYPLTGQKYKELFGGDRKR